MSVIQQPLKLFALLTVFLCCFACGRTTDPNGQFTVTSSTQLLHLSEALARGFKQEQGKAITVKGTLGREHDLLNKDLTQLIITTEKFPAQNSQFVEDKIAFDQAIVISHPDNNVDKLSQTELTKIFTGETKNWKELDGIDRPIQVLTREPGASIKRIVEQNLMDLKGKQLYLNALAVNSNPEMRSAVSKIPGSIGYISTGALNSSVQKIKIVQPNTKFELKAPKVTIYAMWKKGNDGALLKEFLEYLDHSPQAKKIIQEEGYKIP